MRTFIGSGVARSNGGTEHTTRPNLMPTRLSEAFRRATQEKLRELLLTNPAIELVTVNIGGDVYLDLHPCNPQERATAIADYLRALEALELHDRQQGVDNHTTS